MQPSFLTKLASYSIMPLRIRVGDVFAKASECANLCTVNWAAPELEAG
jgi:hypothetical protein